MKTPVYRQGDVFLPGDSINGVPIARGCARDKLQLLNMRRGDPGIELCAACAETFGGRGVPTPAEGRVMGRRRKCVTCWRAPVGVLFCRLCAKSYDRDLHKTQGTMAETIRWAVRRAFAMQRQWLSIQERRR